MRKTDPDKKQAVSRRQFVQVSAAAGLAVAAAGSLRPLRAYETTGSQSSPAGRAPRIGAIYYCGYRWDGTGWQGVPAVSALGRYDSGDIGAIDTHLVWARNYGLSYFLAVSESDAPDDFRNRNLIKLFDRAEANEFDVALLLAPDSRAKTKGDGWLESRLRAVDAAGLLKRKNYLRNGGRPIVAVRSSDATPAAIARIASSDLRLWVIGDAAEPPALPRGAVWTAPVSNGSPLFDAMRGTGKVVLLPISSNKSLPAIAPEQLSAYGRSKYIVVDAFNDWSRRPTVEPTSSDKSQALYVSALRKQLDNLVR